MLVYYIECTKQLFVKSLYYLGITILTLFIYLSSYKEISEIPEDAEFDYIIVGAGSAGTTILAGLPQTSKVLLLEAGSHKSTSLLDIPVVAPMLQRSLYDWSYETERQYSSCQAMNDHSCKWPTGKGFGGSNILNNMIYHRNHPEDFRGWFSDSRTYNYENDILPHFIELEKTLGIKEPNFQTEFSNIFLKAFHKNSEVEFFKPNITQKNGMRWSMAHHYIQHFNENQQNSNHKIVVNAFVIKILFHDDVNNEKISIENNSMKNTAYGVEYEKNNLIYRAFARKGVILCAGTIGTPKILLHSGIGPCNDLENISIKCRENLPVGRNLQDHITTGLDLITLSAPIGLSIFDLISLKNLYQFIFKGYGSLTSNGCDLLGFLKNSNENLPPDLGFMIIPLGISTDYGVNLRYNFNIEDYIWDDYFSHLTDIQTISILPILLHPKSHGYIKLINNNPKIEPKIIPKYLTHRDDIELLIKGIRYIQKFIKNPKLRKYNAKIYEKHLPGCHNIKFDTNTYWECYIRHLTLSVYHPVGTCKIGSYNNSETVVLQNNFQVKNIEKLYVVDASIIPNLTSGNPNSAVMMIAKKFLKLILKDIKDTLTENIVKDSKQQNEHVKKSNTEEL